MDDKARAAHESTDYVIGDIEQLVAAASLIAIDHFTDNTQEQRALRGVIEAISQRLTDLDERRSAEWSAITGKVPEAEKPAA